eukprot:gene16871-18949_t
MSLLTTRRGSCAPPATRQGQGHHVAVSPGGTTHCHRFPGAGMMTVIPGADAAHAELLRLRRHAGVPCPDAPCDAGALDTP